MFRFFRAVISGSQKRAYKLQKLLMVMSALKYKFNLFFYYRSSFFVRISCAYLCFVGLLLPLVQSIYVFRNIEEL